MTGVAIFVKTPGLSPVKTRLAQGIGTEAARAFHGLGAEAVAAVARAAMPAVTPYWAVAEREGLGHQSWTGFPPIWQGEGGLGARMGRVYAALLARHGSALLIGADAPQVTPGLLLEAAASARDGPPYVVGPARDGGFWLFGGRGAVPEAVWQGVAYSRADTLAQFLLLLSDLGPVARVATLVDADEVGDLPSVLAALTGLDAGEPAQGRLAGWLRGVLAQACRP